MGENPTLGLSQKRRYDAFYQWVIKVYCQYCKQKIGVIQRLRDKEYCCSAHRIADTQPSARRLRELGELEYHTIDPWTQESSQTLDSIRVATAATSSSNSRSTATAVALVGMVLLALAFFAPEGSMPEVSEEKSRGGGWFAKQVNSVLSNIPRPSPSVQYRADFSTGSLSNWQAAASNFTSGWSIDNGLLRPGGLRIWQQSRNLADYRFEFQGRVDNAAINWAVRASNSKNFYATKLQLPGRGRKNTELIRFSMIDGRESKRIRMPLPITLEAKSFYRYEVTAREDKFVTIVGGRVIDIWRDPRLKQGGVGFLSEGNEKASIRWAKVSVGDDMIDRLKGFLTFGLLVPQL